MIPEIDQTVFNYNLLLTQAYCDLQLQTPFENNAKVLRTINPEVNGEPVFSFGVSSHAGFTCNETNWSVDPYRSDENFYLQLFEEQVAYKQKVLKDVNLVNMQEGRILIALVDNSVTDGASEAETDGFIDVFDCPPIETWFYFINTINSRMLFAWVPEQFIAAVNIGIAVNPMDCIYWYNNDGVFTNPYHENTLTFLQTKEVESKKLIERILTFFRVSK